LKYSTPKKQSPEQGTMGLLLQHETDETCHIVGVGGERLTLNDNSCNWTNSINGKSAVDSIKDTQDLTLG